VSKLLLRPVADGLLAAVVAAFDTAGIELPERRAVVAGNPGLIAWDCEQLTVALAGISTGGGAGAITLMPQSGSPAGMALTRLATWSVQIVRCAPTSDEDGNPPSVELLEAAAATALDDAGVLSQCLTVLASATPGSVNWLPIGSVINAGAITSLGPDTHQGIEALVTVSVMEVA
jgi:hypothetical protein